MFAHLSKFLYLLLKVGAAPGTPDAGNNVLYAKTDGYLCVKDDAGVERAVATQPGRENFAVAAGTADAITASLTPTPTLTDGMRVFIRASGGNTITNPTLNLNGGGAVTIFKNGGVALAVGDINGAGHELELVYRASVPRWELLNPKVNLTAGSGAYLTPSRVESSTVATNSTTAIPFDNTTPLITEGDEYSALNLTHNKASATSVLRARVFIPLVSANNTVDLTFALFCGSVCIGTTVVTIDATNYSRQVVVGGEISGLAIGAHNFSVRWGRSANTGYINRLSGTAALHNGALKARIDVDEIEY